jgi:hypothetical protein
MAPVIQTSWVDFKASAWSEACCLREEGAEMGFVLNWGEFVVCVVYTSGRFPSTCIYVGGCAKSRSG